LALGNKVKKVAMYEPPYNDDPDSRRAFKAYRKQLAELVAADRRGDALISFMMLVGMPAEHAPEVRQLPMWPMWEAIAPTLAYDAAALGEDASIPTGRAAGMTMPALIVNGAESFPFMHTAAAALAKAMPHAQHRILAGQTHEVKAEAIAPVLVEFFT
jgi:pimeloyl-ACP methyl ester carboxylesterase